MRSQESKYLEQPYTSTCCSAGSRLLRFTYKEVTTDSSFGTVMIEYGSSAFNPFSRIPSITFQMSTKLTAIQNILIHHNNEYKSYALLICVIKPYKKISFGYSAVLQQSCTMQIEWHQNLALAIRGPDWINPPSPLSYLWADSSCRLAC